MSPTLASTIGIDSFPPAVVFAVLYLFVLAFFFTKAISGPVHIYTVLALFCSIRLAAFILRALLSHVSSIANQLHVLIAYEILYNIGFFGLLYSAYTLVADRTALVRNPPNDPFSRLLRFRILFRVALAVGVALGILGVLQTSTGHTIATINAGISHRKDAIYIFFAAAVIVLLHTFILAHTESSEGGYHGATNQVGSVYGVYILLAISILFVARESFLIATANNSSKQNNEAFWYPLAALTEFIATILFAAPGLVPDVPKDP